VRADEIKKQCPDYSFERLKSQAFFGTVGSASPFIGHCPINGDACRASITGKWSLSRKDKIKDEKRQSITIPKLAKEDEK
jgi:hypothetical protein